MQYIELEKIKKDENIRKDYGDMDELVASIETTGVRQAVKLDKNRNLLDGYRRLKAVEIINERRKKEDKELLKIPFYTDEESCDRIVEQMIAGIFPKNITPIEEAKAFKLYMNKQKISTEILSQTLGKKKNYIERRLFLLKLSGESLKVYDDGKIQLGHATLLGQMDENQQKQCLKIILDNKMSVGDLADQLRWNKKINLETSFDNLSLGEKKEKQTLLDEVAGDIPPGHTMTTRLQSFQKEMHEYINTEKNKLQDRNIQIFRSIDKLKKKHPDAEEISSYEQGYTRIVNSLPGNTKYAVVIDWDGNFLTKKLFRLQKKKEEEQKTEETKQDNEKAEKMLNLSRKERLMNKVNEYKHLFLIDTTKDILQEKTKEAKALILYALIDGAKYSNFLARKNMESILKEIKIKVPEWGSPAIDMKIILGLSEPILDRKIFEVATSWINWMYGENIDIFAKASGVRLNKDFKMNEEYAKLHTKDQLINLAKESGFKVNDFKKASDMRVSIVKNWKKGIVPKLMEKL